MKIASKNCNIKMPRKFILSSKCNFAQKNRKFSCNKAPKKIIKTYLLIIFETIVTKPLFRRFKLFF